MPGEKDVLLIVNTRNTEFKGHEDACQNSQDNEETNKANKAAVLQSALSG